MLFNGADARYQQLADELTRQIDTRALKPLERLVSEPAVARQYGVSRVTVRSAIEVLERRGLVVRRRGVGTFVSGARVRQELSTLGGFYESMVDQGFEPKPVLLEFELVAVEGELARRLGHDSAALLVRQFILDGEPVALTHAYLHPDVLRASWSVAEETTAVHLIERFAKRRIENVDVKVRAATAGDRAPYLGLNADEPILIFERTSSDAGGCGLECTSWYLRPDVYEFGMQMHGPFALRDGFHHRPPSAKPH